MNPGPVPKKQIPAALLVLAGTLVLCILPASAVTITDDAGMIITLNATPLRIVSLSPSNTEILAGLGLTDRIAGVTDVCDYPPEVMNKTRIGSYSAISIEKVAAARPDLVVASDLTPKETEGRLRDLGLTVAVIAPRNTSHMIKDLRMVGMLTGTENQADEMASRLSDRLDAIRPCTSEVKIPTVAHIVWNDPLYVSGNDTLQNDVITMAGGKNVFADRNGWGTVTLEEFLMRNPDIILVNGGDGMEASGNDIILGAFMTNPQYSSLAAVRNNRVYAVNADIISRPAPRIVDATEQVARLLHPECFTGAAAGFGTIPAPTVKSPGFCAGGAILIIAICAIISRARGRS